MARERTFRIDYWWFLPAELLIGFLSGLIGAMGPILNSLYLNAGITKERMIGTKTAISFPMHFTKIGSYAVFGAITGELLLFGLAAGCGALISNMVAKRVLRRITETNFRALIVAFMALSGAIMLWEQRHTLLALI